MVHLPAAGGVLSAEQVEHDAGAAAKSAKKAEKDRLDGPGPVPGPEWGSRYCWTLLTGLSHRWSPARPLPDMASALRWPRVTAWADVVASLTKAGAGARAYIRLGRPNRLGHGIALINTNDQGLVLINPDQNRSEGYTSVIGTQNVTDWLSAPDGLGTRDGLPLIDARAYFQNPGGQVIHPLGQATPASESTAQALTDPTDPHVGMPWMGSFDDGLTWEGAAYESDLRRLREDIQRTGGIDRGRLVSDYPSVRSGSDAEILAQLGPGYATENRDTEMWFVHRPAGTQTQRPTGNTGPSAFTGPAAARTLQPPSAADARAANESDLRRLQDRLQRANPGIGVVRFMIDDFHPSFRGVGDNELLTQLGPGYAIENRDGFRWFVHRPAGAQTGSESGYDFQVNRVDDVSDAVVRGLRRTLEDTADPALRARLHEASASWTGPPAATGPRRPAPDIARDEDGGEWASSSRSGTGGGGGHLDRGDTGRATAAEASTPATARSAGEAAVDGAGRGQVRVSLQQLERVVGDGTAAGVAAMRSEAGSAGPVPGPEMGQYCLAVIEHIIGAFYGPSFTTGAARQVVGGITSGLTRDDGLIEAGDDARRGLGQPAAAWGRLDDWRTLIIALGTSEPGTTMVVVNEQSGSGDALDLRHVAAFVHTEDGVVLINPAQPGQATTIDPLDTAAAPAGRLAESATLLATVLGPPINSRVLSIDPHRQVIIPDWATTRESDSAARAMLDPANPRIGAPRRQRRSSRLDTAAEAEVPVPVPWPPLALARQYGYTPGQLGYPEEGVQERLERVFPRDGRGAFRQFPDPRSTAYSMAGGIRWLNRREIHNTFFTASGSSDWIQAINGNLTNVGYRANCVDVARSVLESWAGRPTVAAPVSVGQDGAPVTETDGILWTSTWLGAQLRAPEDTAGRRVGANEAWEAIAGHLRAHGHGSSALVFFRPSGAAREQFVAATAHAVVGLNYQGTVYWVDAQWGRVSHRPLYEGELFQSVEFDPQFRPIRSNYPVFVTQGYAPQQYDSGNGGPSFSAAGWQNAGALPEELGPIDWQKSSHSRPDKNGVETCVSVAVVGLRLGVGR
ncbi:toxin glutamine deamidase domain-containing protein [Actinoallomurus rhizosphaericola]|uniref:toxin glutamine deamidase domain-containing protein n=1 Tax=Actinoallomurus rhizosphaericola TaxID=2952536 RepID=UPI002090F007|nr:toxin glutamine deamidase domain-containing protein [Actinoallomurus rhizosphaericola]MCO5994116.1 toxin glutamine deamidase domain-containing protein [Actinoallomurus rhizosphaericola]